MLYGDPMSPFAPRKATLTNISCCHTSDFIHRRDPFEDLAEPVLPQSPHAFFQSLLANNRCIDALDGHFPNGVAGHHQFTNASSAFVTTLPAGPTAGAMP